MKKIILILAALIFPPSPSYAGEWTEVAESVQNGNVYYVNTESIRTHAGFIYYWDMSNNLTPTQFGNLSNKLYHIGDCTLFRQKTLSRIYYKKPMGEGTGKIDNVTKGKWDYPNPDSVAAALLKFACDQTKESVNND